MNEIDELLREIEPPDVDVADDVTRGERALRRRHRWQVSGAAVSVVTVVVLTVAVVGGGPGSGSTAPGFVDHPRASAHSSTPPHADRTHHPHVGSVPAEIRRLRNQARPHMGARGSQATLRTYHQVLAEHLDPNGTQLRLAQNEQGGSGSFGTKLDWRHGGMLEIVVGRSFAAAGGFYLLEGAGMQDTTYDGHPARVSTAGRDLVVSVRHGDGTVVTLIASTAFGNNGTSTASLGLTQEQLLEAAADPRLQLPAYLR
jgi:hypothetical protein